MDTPRKLIVTADDFGADLAVNAAVERAYRYGLLTATSLMVAGPAAADAVARAKVLPGLGIGLHLVLVEGRPVLPPERIPDLVDGNGFFRTDMSRQGARIFFIPRVRRQLAAEIEAQFAAFAATGLQLDHVNSHKHYHLHPTIAALALGIGARYGLKAMRLPYEPKAVIRAIEPGRVGTAIERWQARFLARRLDRAGVFHPDRIFGLAWSGKMTEARLLGLLEHLPAGISEIYFHPALADRYPQSARGYLYRAEADALVSKEALEFVKKIGIERKSFSAFQAAA